MNEIIFSVEEAPEGGYLARAIGHSIFTEADTLEALRAVVCDAVRCHFDDREGDEPDFGRFGKRSSSGFETLTER